MQIRKYKLNIKLLIPFLWLLLADYDEIKGKNNQNEIQVQVFLMCVCVFVSACLSVCLSVCGFE